jgi:hypothetical protein
VGNTLGGVVAGGLLGAIVGFGAGWFLTPTGGDRQAFAMILGVVLLGNGVTAGAVVGGVEDILRGMRRQGDTTPPPAS